MTDHSDIIAALADLGTPDFERPVELIVLDLARSIASPSIDDGLRERIVEALRVAISPEVWEERKTLRGAL